MSNWNKIIVNWSICKDVLYRIIDKFVVLGEKQNIVALVDVTVVVTEIAEEEGIKVEC